MIPALLLVIPTVLAAFSFEDEIHCLESVRRQADMAMSFESVKNVQDGAAVFATASGFIVFTKDRAPFEFKAPDGVAKVRITLPADGQMRARSFDIRIDAGVPVFDVFKGEVTPVKVEGKTASQSQALETFKAQVHDFLDALRSKYEWHIDWEPKPADDSVWGGIEPPRLETYNRSMEACLRVEAFKPKAEAIRKAIAKMPRNAWDRTDSSESGVGAGRGR